MTIFVCILILILVILLCKFYKEIDNNNYKKLRNSILDMLNLNDSSSYLIDETIQLKSAKAVEEYNDIKYFKEDKSRLDKIEKRLEEKERFKTTCQKFLNSNDFSNSKYYPKIAQEIEEKIKWLETFNVNVIYVSPAGKKWTNKYLKISNTRAMTLKGDPAILMTKSEYNQYAKEVDKERINRKQQDYYDKVNKIIDTANDYRDKLISEEDKNELDRVISLLYERAAKNIRKIKTADSPEWKVIENFISQTETDVNKIIAENQKILDYYESDEFNAVKVSCQNLINSQKDFNNYIDEKAKSIARLFGTRVVRNDTIIDDKYDYIRPYKKTITPFVAEVSANVFASAENKPLEYVIKYFYPNKTKYPEQIQNLKLLIEELETLSDAKEILNNYKKEYKQYLNNVPEFIFKKDEDGFYSKLGFANINENTLTVEYKFSYTSNGGFTQRSFTVPMTESTIAELIQHLESKLTMSSFVKEQRLMMTKALRNRIKERDNYTCKNCGNSIYKEPNLLLEIDHIIPVSKGGYTTEENLQTLCWRCNRSKGSKLV